MIDDIQEEVKKGLQHYLTQQSFEDYLFNQNSVNMQENGVNNQYKKVQQILNTLKTYKNKFDRLIKFSRQKDSALEYIAQGTRKRASTEYYDISEINSNILTQKEWISIQKEGELLIMGIREFLTGYPIEYKLKAISDNGEYIEDLKVDGRKIVLDYWEPWIRTSTEDFQKDLKNNFMKSKNSRGRIRQEIFKSQNKTSSNINNSMLNYIEQSLTNRLENKVGSGIGGRAYEVYNTFFGSIQVAPSKITALKIWDDMKTEEDLEKYLKSETPPPKKPYYKQLQKFYKILTNYRADQIVSYQGGDTVEKRYVNGRVAYAQYQNKASDSGVVALGTTLVYIDNLITILTNFLKIEGSSKIAQKRLIKELQDLFIEKGGKEDIARTFAEVESRAIASTVRNKLLT